MSQYASADEDVMKRLPQLKESARRLTISLPDSEKILGTCIVFLKDYFNDSLALPDEVESKRSMVEQSLSELRNWTTAYKEAPIE